MGTYVVAQPRNVNLVVSSSPTYVVVSSTGIQGPPGVSGGGQRASSFFTGNGATTTFTLTHSLSSKYVTMTFWLTNVDVTDEPVLLDWQPINTTTARVTFPVSRPLASGWRIDWLATG